MQNAEEVPPHRSATPYIIKPRHTGISTTFTCPDILLDRYLAFAYPLGQVFAYAAVESPSKNKLNLIDKSRKLLPIEVLPTQSSPSITWPALFSSQPSSSEEVLMCPWCLWVQSTLAFLRKWELLSSHFSRHLPVFSLFVFLWRGWLGMLPLLGDGWVGGSLGRLTDSGYGT